MGRQIQIVATAKDEELLLEYLRSTTEIQVLRHRAPSVDDFYVDELAPYDQDHSQYHIWNTKYAWRPTFREANDGTFYVGNAHDGPTIDLDRADMDEVLAHGLGIFVGRLYWAHYNRQKGFEKWFESILRWVRRTGVNLNRHSGSFAIYSLPDAMSVLRFRAIPGWPTQDELMVLGDYFEERGDPRAEIARNVVDPNDAGELLQLLTESDKREAACVFAERVLTLEREHHREPPQSAWAAIEAKRAWLRGEIKEKELQAAGDEARSDEIEWRNAKDDLERAMSDAVSTAVRAAWPVSAKRNATYIALSVVAAATSHARVVTDSPFGPAEKEKPWPADWIMRKAWSREPLEAEKPMKRVKKSRSATSKKKVTKKAAKKMKAKTVKKKAKRKK